MFSTEVNKMYGMRMKNTPTGYSNAHLCQTQVNFRERFFEDGKQRSLRVSRTQNLRKCAEKRNPESLAKGQKALSPISNI